MDAVNEQILTRYWRICWPAALEGLLIVLLSSADLVMVSSLGAAAVAAVGVFSQPKMVILCVSRALSITVTAVIARSYGGGETKDLSAFLKQMTLLTSLLATALFVLTQVAMEQILLIAGAETAYISQALAYGRLANINLLFYAPAMIINAGLTGLGQTKPLLISNVVGNLVNVFLNATFLFVFKLGVGGAGLATAIGGAVTLICSISFSLRKDCMVSLKGMNSWWLTRGTLSQIKDYFGGIFLELSFERLGMFLYTLMTARLGMIDFAIHNICMTLCDIYYSFGQGFSRSSLALAGMLSSCQKKDRKQELLRTAKWLPGICALVAAMGYALSATRLIGLFSNDPLILERGARVLLLCLACCVEWGIRVM